MKLVKVVFDKTNMEDVGNVISRILESLFENKDLDAFTKEKEIFLLIM